MLAYFEYAQSSIHPLLLGHPMSQRSLGLYLVLLGLTVFFIIHSKSSCFNEMASGRGPAKELFLYNILYPTNGDIVNIINSTIIKHSIN
jgi:hypothetical protein